jgi:predicted MFS family arabinose efflux permease
MSEQFPSATNEPGTKEESIFSGVYDLAPYEKTMKNARIWLYVIAGAQLLMGIYEYNTIDDKTVGAIASGIDAFIALTFLGLSLWSKKKPVIAFTIALVFYIVIVLGLALLSGDFMTLAKGIIFKILVVVALVKANRDARQYEAIKQSLGEEV